MPKTIMIVDDSASPGLSGPIVAQDHIPMHRARVRDLLSSAGYRCLEASDGTRAVELFEIEAPDAALMDLEMPGMDGVLALQEIRRLHPHARVAMFSVYGNGASRDLALSYGAVDYVLKGASNDRVLQCVRGLLGEPQTPLVAK